MTVHVLLLCRLKLAGIYVVRLQDFTKFTVHRYSLESQYTSTISASVVAVLHSAVIDSWAIVLGHVKITLQCAYVFGENN